MENHFLKTVATLRKNVERVSNLVLLGLHLFFYYFILFFLLKTTLHSVTIFLFFSLSQ